MRGRAEFRRVVGLLQAELRAAGITMSATAVADLLAEAVKTGAAAMRVREETFVRSHMSLVDVAALVAACRAALANGEREVADTPPTILDLGSAGRLIASLGQAVRCVSLNHEALGGGERDKWQAIGVLDDAGNALTLFGAALDGVDRGPDRVSVLLSDETVVHARRALAQTVQNLTDGAWTFQHGADLDAQVAERMAADLALLPPG
jgi:hypothetical protein